MPAPNRQPSVRHWLRALPALLVILSLACSLPGLPQPAPSAPATTSAPGAIGPAATYTAVSSPIPTQAPIPTPSPLPPALVESDPPPGAQIPLAKPITLYFNQPMNRATVEGALSGQPSLAGRFHWADDATVTFVPDAPLLPETNVVITVSATAQSQNGLTLLNPLAIKYRTVGYLRLAQGLPEAGAGEVDPASAVVATFNQPVVPLGGDPASLPAGFTISNTAGLSPAGRGEWINTSTYIFYPQPALAGGAAYSVHVNPDLEGVDGSPFDLGAGRSDQGGRPREWSFTTALPRLVGWRLAEPGVEVQPGAEAPPPNDTALVRLDPQIVLTFNQAMQPQSVQGNFALRDPVSQAVAGEFAWSKDEKTLTFTPSGLLKRNTAYTLHLAGAARARGGTPLGRDFVSSFSTVPDLAVLFTQPAQGGTKNTYEGVSVTFSAQLQRRSIPGQGDALQHREKDLLPYFTFSPAVPNLGAFLSEDQGLSSSRTVILNGDFAPSTAYTLTVSPQIADQWGELLEQPFTLNFRTRPLDSNLIISQGYDLLYLTPQNSNIPAQAVNLSQVNLTLGSVPFGDFVKMLAPGGYDFRLNYRPADARTWTQNLEVAPDRSQPVELDLTPDGEAGNNRPNAGVLAPGMYLLRINPVGTVQGQSANALQLIPYLLVVSRVHLTFKLSPTDALVWAVNLESLSPGADLPVAIYEENGSTLALGMTGVDGVFGAAIPPLADLYRTRYAMTGQPGEENFGLALSTWSQGVEGWDFNIPVNYTAPGLKVYLYTDRPIYRPGQTVYFRLVARQAANGRYTLPDTTSMPLKVYNETGEELSSLDLPLSAFGTAHGEFLLPEDAQPGTYRIGTALPPNEGQADVPQQSALDFQVADYRKPEINLQVSFGVGEHSLDLGSNAPEAGQGGAKPEALAGQTLVAQVNARYFFDAPASDVPVRWSLYSQPATFDPGLFSSTGYQVGVEDLRWLQDLPLYFAPTFGSLVKEGSARIGPDGKLTLEIPAEVYQAGGSSSDLPSRKQYTLEVTLTDESGLPVSARAEILVNPAPFYIGVRPDQWVGQAGQETGFDVQVVDWEGKPAGARTLRAEFRKVIWLRDDSLPLDPFGSPRYTPHYTPVGQTDFATGEDGIARLAFTPTEPGTYQLSVSAAFDPKPGESDPAPGENALTRFTLWIGGPGQPAWPNLPNQRLRLTSDRPKYRPGDTAQVFIPNPFALDALALVTVERGVVMQHQVLSLDGSGTSLSLPLSGEAAPNIYVSVTIIGRNDSPGNSPGRYEFRQGYLNLAVEPVDQVLQVDLVRQPEPGREVRAIGPGEQVSFSIRVSDSAGQPVQGEFSLSVVDLAALALAEPNAPDIVPAFYGQQPLGVRTSLDLVADPWRLQTAPSGQGGGGEEGLAPVVRENFPDTAYWNAEVVTDAAGEAQVTVTLPDTLTTWQVSARGVTAEARVGQAETNVITTKELLVRPVTPRFLVAGDHALLAAVVQNNTNGSLDVDVSLQTTGFELDDAQGGSATAARRVSLPAGGRARVEWWGTAQSVDSADLVFSAVSGSLQDAARPAGGALPVLRYISPQTFATVGVLGASSGAEFAPSPGEGQPGSEARLSAMELVSLPRSALEAGQPLQGDLRLELSPSLAAAMLNALDVLEHSPNESTEQTLSRFLPNLVVYHALQSNGLQAPGLGERLNRALAEGLQRLLARQNPDGGWGWWSGSFGVGSLTPGLGSNAASDPYMTAYALFGLSEARQAGVSVEENMVQKAIDYLYSSLAAPAMTGQPWQLDRLAMVHFALAWAGGGVLNQDKGMGSNTAGDPGGLSTLYGERDRLSPWAQALLALSLEKISPDDPRVETLLSGLQSTAIRSATGVHWEDPSASMPNSVFRAEPGRTPVNTTAIVVYSLAQLHPASTLLPEAVLYLMAHRQAQGGWGSTYETAWNLMAITRVVEGTGELNGNFNFSATLNGTPIARGQAGPSADISPVKSSVPVQALHPDESNVLLIRRDPGAGRLYYSAYLNVASPVKSVPPLNRGFTVSRAYYASKSDHSPLQSARVGDQIAVRLTLVLPNDAYYLQVEDYIPAGAEILDTRLKTSQIGAGGEAGPLYDPSQPFASGWGWWYFHPAKVYDNRITWAADYLPAGTYELAYTLVMVQPGEYNVLPARAWEVYFPEVQGSSAGTVFQLISREIKPGE